MVGSRSAGGNVLLLERQPANSIPSAVERLSAAAEQGHDVLLAEAALLFKSAVRNAQIMVRSGGVWQVWNAADIEGDLSTEVSDLLERATSGGDIVSEPSCHVFPIEPSGVALLVEDTAIGDIDTEYVTTIGHTLRLALRYCEGRYGDPDKLDAIRTFQRVASRILKSQNLKELFQQITNQAKARLSADICGILLLQNDELVMERCVGNWVIETEVLRMRAGQGVAGRVLAQGKPCSIEDYLNNSGQISPDFFHLARAERVRSALAVPLYSHDKMIGVLEVWRRKPSQFTPQNCAELGALADLTSLAIENVRLVQARAAAASRLEEAHRELSRRYSVIERSAQLQEVLIATHLAGGKLQDIIEQASLTLGLTVAYFDRTMAMQACHPRGSITEAALRKIRSEFALNKSEQQSIQPGARLDFVCKRVAAAAEHFGWIVLWSPQSERDELQLVLNEICVTTALHIMKETAASRALTDKIATLTWDLLDSTPELREIALERVKDCGIDLKGDVYLLACRIEDLDQGAPGVRASSDFETRKRAIIDVVSDMRDRHREIKLFALRGAELGIIATLKTFARAREVADKLIADFGREIDGTACTIGISRGVRDPMQIGVAWKDARRAQRVARQLGQNRAIGLSQAGVAGLLIGLQEGADFRDFVEDQIGKIREEDVGQRDTLLKTLRIYFSAGCSRQETSSSLGIHPKTLVYRLKKVERITGLNLDHHEDRVLLDLALKMDQLLA